MQPDLHPDTAQSDAVLVTNAAIRAAANLQITNKVLARIIGVSEATVSRMSKGAHALESNQKPFELALMFVRLYRSLDAIVGGDDAVAALWLSNQNTALNGAPLDLIQTVSGLNNVIQYLDARRALV